MEALFEGLQRGKLVEWEFHAAIHGVELGGKKSSTAKHSDPEVPLFGDPAEYQSMSLEEKEKETEKMQNKHKRWSGQSFLKGK